MLYAHLSILVATLVAILYSDQLAWRYLVGNIEVLDERTMRRLHYAVGAGLVGMVATGAWMAYPAFWTLWALPLFKLKLAFVALLALNTFNMGLAIDVASMAPFRELPAKQKARLLFGGALSSFSWLGAIVCAFILFGNLSAWLAL